MTICWKEIILNKLRIMQKYQFFLFSGCQDNSLSKDDTFDRLFLLHNCWQSQKQVRSIILVSLVPYHFCSICQRSNEAHLLTQSIIFHPLSWNKHGPSRSSNNQCIPQFFHDYNLCSDRLLILLTWFALKSHIQTMLKACRYKRLWSVHNLG